MDDDVLFVTDKTFISDLDSNDGEAENVQYFVDFLSYKKTNKKVFTISKHYFIMHSRCNSNEELNAYFSSYVEEGICIGMSDKNPDVQEFETLLDYFSKIFRRVIFVSSNQDLINELSNGFIDKKINLLNWKKLKRLLEINKEFSDYMFREYYDSSA